MEQLIPKELKEIYPFKSNFINLDSTHKMHYIDEGSGEVILMLHGNPTWSFFYRNLILSLSKKYRVIAPDHLGCGLSTKDSSYDYTLKNHIFNIETLLKNLNIERFSLVLHDWGGAIGMGVATNNPTRINKIIAMNTAAFLSDEIPFRISILKNPIGEKLIQGLNAFAYPATFMAVKKALSKTVKKGFLYPYQNYNDRIATARFVRDIPMDKEHTSYETLLNIQNNLKEIHSPILLLWGEKDFCFTMNFYKRWKGYFPNAKGISYPSAGHYLLEDEFNLVNKEITSFMEQ
jgi:haloalkane dehalogenase